MNILIIQGGSNHDLPSGEDTVILSDWENLTKEHNVNIEYIENPKGALKKIFGLVWSFDNYARLNFFLDKYSPDVVHFHTVTPYLSLSVLYAAKKSGARVVQTLHNGRWICIEGGFFRDGMYCDRCIGGCGVYGVIKSCKYNKTVSFLFFMVNFVARKSMMLFNFVDKFIAVSEFVRDAHVRSGFPASKVVVINNSVGVNLKKDKDYLSREGVVFSGRVSIAKGANILKYLIPIMQHHPFHIIGSGEELQKLKLFCDLNKYNHVTFWGKQSRDKVLEILSCASCAIVPSQCGESFSMAAAESMSVGTPVVTFNVGGVSSLVKSGGGSVVEDKDLIGFAKKVLLYLENPDIVKNSGTKGRGYVFQNLSNEVKNEKLIKVYKADENNCF
jgi:glycosyltransferase involved in cell wall biosynthesis